MADGFDECHKIGLSAGPCVQPPRSVAVSHKEMLQNGACFSDYLHPGDPDANHVYLLT